LIDYQNAAKESAMNSYQIEYTDTFGGQANYCWVKRAKIHMP